MKKSKANTKVSAVMKEFKAGKLHAGKDPDGKGPRKAPTVKNPKQALAIALSQAGKAKGHSSANKKQKGK